MIYISMKHFWISTLLFLPFWGQTQIMSNNEQNILKNTYGELYYGNEQFSFDTFFEKDSLKYVYSITKKTLCILDTNNQIISETKVRITKFVLPQFSINNQKVILQSFDTDRAFCMIEGSKAYPQKKNIPNKVIACYVLPIDAATQFEVHQKNVSPSQKLSKVLLYKVNEKEDTLYKDIKTRINREVNTSPRVSLCQHQGKVYFFNADQQLILIFDTKGNKLDEINLKKTEDEHIATYMLNFLVDIQTNKLYVTTVLSDKTYIWDISAQKNVRRYELPFRIHQIHQILKDDVYFSMNTEDDRQYIYKRSFK